MSQPATYPIFLEWGKRLGELADLLGYSQHTLLAIMDGRQPASNKFKAHAVAVLDKPEAELFGDMDVALARQRQQQELSMKSEEDQP